MVAYNVGDSIVNESVNYNKLEFNFLPLPLLVHFIAIAFIIYHLIQGIRELHGKNLNATILRFFSIIYSAIIIFGQISIFFLADNLKLLYFLSSLCYMSALTYLLWKDILLMHRLNKT